MDMHHPFLEWRQYYGAAPGEIESGDLPLRTLVIPVLQALRARRRFDRCELMRYSLQGYHWRVKLRVDAGGDLDSGTDRVRDHLSVRVADDDRLAGRVLHDRAGHDRRR